MKPVLLVYCCLVIVGRLAAQPAGKPLAIWHPGQLDIHHISTGRGNATFCILPDGTTLLVDAGSINPIDWRTARLRKLPTRPDTTRRAGEWIARYISRAMGFTPNPALDYAVLTHFHDDHVGSPVLAPRKPKADYALTGITEVAEYIPIKRVFDRGWPDYQYPYSLKNDSIVVNYQRFLGWQREQAGLEVERIVPGRADQLVLLRQPHHYRKKFEIRTVAVNGDIWTGHASEVKPHFPALTDLLPEQSPSENMCSVVLRIRYGDFAYFTGGDIPGVLKPGQPTWHDVEAPIAAVTGPVDVQVMNHHGYEDAQSVNLLASLQPRVLIIPAWDASHPARTVLERIYAEGSYAGERDVFTTNLLPQTAQNLGELQHRLKNRGGHVVVRVMPGGATYYVLVVNDSDESTTVKASYGPYRSK